MKEIMMNFVINNLIVRSVNIKVKKLSIYLSRLRMTNLVGKSVSVDLKKMRNNMKWKLKEKSNVSVNFVIIIKIMFLKDVLTLLTAGSAVKIVIKSLVF